VVKDTAALTPFDSGAAEPDRVIFLEVMPAPCTCCWARWAPSSASAGHGWRRA
jgi:hypothetical protein